LLAGLFFTVQEEIFMGNPRKIITRFIISLVLSFSLFVLSTPTILAFEVKSKLLLHNGVTNQFPHTVYFIPLKNITDHFSNYCDLVKNKEKLAKRKKSFKQFFKADAISVENTDPYPFFYRLLPGKKYTYILNDNKLVFTKVYSIKDCKKCSELMVPNNCRTSKHLFLSKQKLQVRMAGEFRVYKHPSRKKLFVVFDNSSGHYNPDPAKVPFLVNLLNENLKSNDDVEFIAKMRGQIFNPSTLKVENSHKRNKVGSKQPKQSH
jgi:hypothetical protein